MAPLALFVALLTAQQAVAGPLLSFFPSPSPRIANSTSAPANDTYATLPSTSSISSYSVTTTQPLTSVPVAPSMYTETTPSSWHVSGASSVYKTQSGSRIAIHSVNPLSAPHSRLRFTHTTRVLSSPTTAHHHSSRSFSSHRRASSRRSKSSTRLYRPTSTPETSPWPRTTSRLVHSHSSKPTYTVTRPSILSPPYVTHIWTQPHASATPDAPSSDQPSQDTPRPIPSGNSPHLPAQLRKLQIVAIFLGIVAILTGIAVLCMVLHDRAERLNSASGLGPSDGGQPGHVIPSMQQLGGFASAESQIYQIGRTRSPSAATDVSFHSADASRSAMSPNVPSPTQNTPDPVDPSSPADLLDGEFGDALSQAFGALQQTRLFPISAYSESPSVSISSQPLRRPEALECMTVESQRGSIGQALSMISAPDRLSGAAFSQDGRSLKSAKSVRSALTGRLRLSRISSMSQAGQKQARKSITASVGTRTSLGSIPSPDPSDVHALFSGSQDSIVIGMPSAPPTSFASQGPVLEGDIISRSPMNIPNELLNNGQLEATSPPGAFNADRVRAAEASYATPSALHNALLFNSSFSMAAPASPSSDGVGFGMGSSSASMVSSRHRMPPRSFTAIRETKSVATSTRSTHNSRTVASSPSASPSSLLDVPSPVLVASITSKSMALADAIDSLETEAIYASFPSIPDHLSSPSSSKSFRSHFSDERERQSPRWSPNSARKLSPPHASMSHPNEITSPAPSMDISSALHPISDLNLLLGAGVHASSSQHSSLSLSVNELLAQRPMFASLSVSDDTISLEGMDISDGGLYPSRPVSPSTVATSGMSSSSDNPSPDRVCLPLSDDETLLPPLPPSDSSSSSISSWSRLREGLGIPRVIIRSVDGGDISENEPNLPSSFSHPPTSSSSSSTRLAISVMPAHDETTDLIERTLFQIQQRGMVMYDSDEEGAEDDDDELGSFEGDISFIRSPAGSRRSNKSAGSDEEQPPFDDLPIDWSLPSDGPEGAYAAEMRSRLYDDEEVDIGEFGHSSNLAYFSNYAPRPRCSEVAYRAIMNEGRQVEPGQVPRYSTGTGNKDGFAPVRASPLRKSYRASSRCSQTSRQSDGSVYSQHSEVAGGTMSPSWTSSVF